MVPTTSEVKAPTSSSSSQIPQRKRDSIAYALDERRRAALADVDNASFSCVFCMRCPFPSQLITSAVKLVPPESVPRSGCRLLHGRVSRHVYVEFDW